MYTVKTRLKNIYRKRDSKIFWQADGERIGSTPILPFHAIMREI